MSNRYLRSVNIAHDLSAHGAELSGYMATPLVWQTLQRIVAGCEDASAGRAFSIIGPYGTGKSAFGVFLAHWMAADAPLRALLWQRHTTVSSHSVRSDVPRLLPIPLQVKATTLRQAIVATLARIVQTMDAHHPLVAMLTQDALDSEIPPETVAAYVADVASLIRHAGIYAGLLLIIDELGQHLAHIHRVGDARDLFVLQTIAETAARSGDTPIVVVTILHQTFERYNTTASVAQQTEWAKVQGRFVDLTFQEPQTQMVRFVAQVVQGLYPAKRSAAEKALIEQWAAQSSDLGIKSAEFKDKEWRALLNACYPLHPTVVVALPVLFRILAQNERSLFAFLTAQERGGLSEFLAKHPVGSGAIYRLVDLFVYVEQTLGPGLFGRARGRPWVELSETIQRLRHASPMELNILTTVGMLAALKDDVALRASREMLAWAVDGVGQVAFADALAQLMRQQVLVFSAYRDRYRLAEASDIHLDDKIHHARSQLAGQRDVVSMLAQYTALEPVIAYRHTYYSGTLRHFVVRFVTADEATAQHSTAQHSTAQHSTAQHSTAQHSTMVKSGMSLLLTTTSLRVS